VRVPARCKVVYKTTYCAGLVIAVATIAVAVISYYQPVTHARAITDTRTRPVTIYRTAISVILTAVNSDISKTINLAQARARAVTDTRCYSILVTLG
jgi:hypothetical protein